LKITKRNKINEKLKKEIKSSISKKNPDGRSLQCRPYKKPTVEERVYL